MYIFVYYLLFFKIQELYEKQQIISVKAINETQEKTTDLEQFKELLEAKDSALQSIENDRLQLSKRLEESQEEIKVVIKERDELKRVQEALLVERDQLKENIKETVAKVSLPLLIFCGNKISEGDHDDTINC
jgi:centromeric protein E